MGNLCSEDQTLPETRLNVKRDDKRGPIKRENYDYYNNSNVGNHQKSNNFQKALT